MGNSNSSMRDRIRSYYRPLQVPAKPLATATEITQAAVQTKLNLLQQSKTNVEVEYIQFLKEYAPYSNVVLKAPGTRTDLIFSKIDRETVFENYPEIIPHV